MAETSVSSALSSDGMKLPSPALFGRLFDWMLYGALCVQTYVYSYNFTKDTRTLKFLVFFVFLLETARTALIGADLYYWFVAGFGDAQGLLRPYFVPIDVPIMGGVASILVQGYFCYRIWVLNSRRLSLLCLAILIASVIQASAALWLGIKSLISGKVVVSKTNIYLWSIPGALVDILIAVGMIRVLRRANSNFSNFVLIRVVRLTIETNGLTAIMAITILVLDLAFPNKPYYIFPATVIGKVYANTLLVALNNRIYFRDHLPPGNDIDESLPISVRVGATVATTSFAAAEPRPRALSVDISASSTVTLPRNLDNSKGDDASADCSLSTDSRSYNKNETGFPKIPSERQPEP